MWQCPKCSRDFKNMGQNHSCEKVTSIIAAWRANLSVVD